MYEQTPDSIIKGTLRKLFLRSRERAAALKRDHYTCQKCARKQTMKKGFELKVQVHHEDGILNWQLLIEEIRKYLLCDPEKLKTLCKECHDRV